MQIRRARPRAIDERCDVSVSLAIRGEQNISKLNGVKLVHQLLSKWIDAVTIGADVRHDLTKPFAFGCMTSSARSFENVAAVLGQSPIDWKRIHGRRQLKQKIRIAFETFRNYRIGPRANRHRRCVVALLDLVIVSIPVQPHMLPRFLIPNLRQVCGADAVVVG